MSGKRRVPFTILSPKYQKRRFLQGERKEWFWNITSSIYAKYHVQIMLLFVYATTHKRFVIFTCRYFKLSWNTTALSQSNYRNFSCSGIRYRTQLLVPVLPECWIFKMAWLCYFLVSSYRSALFALSKCNLGSISSFLICPPAAEHTLQRNMKENSRTGLKTNTKGSACLQEKAWKL